jgi:glycine cleavage system H lipoate-binding protein
MHYYQIENPGVKGFVTHAENEVAYIGGYPGNIWVTENVDWAARVGATELTQAEAQAIVDIVIAQAQAEWTVELGMPYPQPIILP